MTDETTNTPVETPTEAPDEPRGAAAYTDEQLTSAFPGQDLGHVKSMLNKAAGIGVPTDPHAPTGGSNEPTDGESGDPTSDQGGDPADDDSGVEYPDWMPEKFRTGSLEEAMEKMAGAYKTLEAARGSNNADAGDGDSDVADGGDDGDGEPDVPAVDLRSLEAKFVENGNQLTADDYAAAEKAGLSRDLVDSYLAGQQAIADQLVTKVHALVGGPENYDAMLQWMVGNADKAEVEAYDQAMGTGKLSDITLAVRGMHSAYVAAVGSDQGRQVKQQTGTPQSPGYQSKREMIDAMKDPRYQKDPAYRAEVARRIDQGNVW